MPKCRHYALGTRSVGDLLAILHQTHNFSSACSSWTKIFLIINCNSTFICVVPYRGNNVVDYLGNTSVPAHLDTKSKAVLKR